MVGKGSVSHNSRQFHAANTDPERSGLNRSYCNEDIRQVYREMFGEAVKRYNEKQTRSDRIITDYYEKICSGKQEKPFHEIILQIGNCDDMNAKTESGGLAATVLDEYMQSFQSRNPNIRVFSAHLHMDEATPHLHIDFVPFTLGSKRGLDTRVSLKQALAAQGFSGGSRQETEWNQWVSSEKKQLATVMERHGIEWAQKGTHEKHLSVLDYEKKVCSEEIGQLKTQVEDLQADIQEARESADKTQVRLERLQERESLVNLNVGKYDTDPKWQLPEPTMLMTANAYKTKVVEPFIGKLKDVIRSIVAQYLRLNGAVNDLRNRLSRAYTDNERLIERVKEGRQENAKLIELAGDYKRVRKVLGEEQTDSILAKARAGEQALRRPVRFRNRERGR
jgi:hypothetical protein